MQVKEKQYKSIKRFGPYLRNIFFKKWVLLSLSFGIPLTILISPFIYRFAYKNADNLPFSKILISRIKDSWPFQLVELHQQQLAAHRGSFHPSKALLMT